MALSPDSGLIFAKGVNDTLPGQKRVQVAETLLSRAAAPKYDVESEAAIVPGSN